MTTIQKRRGTAAQWSAANPVLAAGEPGYETDTGREKTGNGVSTWSQLEYILGAEGVRLEISEVTGDLADLITTAKDNLVAAINEAAQTGGGGDYVASPATETVAGLGQTATLADVAAGTDHGNKFVTPAGARQESNRIKAEILGGAGPAADTLAELVALINSAEESTLIDALTTQVGLKANAANVYSKTEVGSFSGLATTAQTTLVDAINEVFARTSSNMVTGASGPLKILIEGVDTPTPGATNEVVLRQASSLPGGGGSSGGNYPAGLDLNSGIVGCTISDPALAEPPLYDAAALTDPYRTDGEGSGRVAIVTGNTRFASRFKAYATRIDRLVWAVGDGSTLNVTGAIAICKTDGTILAQQSRTLSPATVSSPYGSTVTWDLTTPITGLTVGQELVVVTQHTSGSIRFLARGLSSLFNQQALRAASELVRSGAINPAPALSGSLMTGPIDFSGNAVNSSGTAVGWTKRGLPVFVAYRTQ